VVCTQRRDQQRRRACRGGCAVRAELQCVRLLLASALECLAAAWRCACYSAIAVSVCVLVTAYEPVLVMHAGNNNVHFSFLHQHWQRLAPLRWSFGLACIAVCTCVMRERSAVTVEVPIQKKFAPFQKCNSLKFTFDEVELLLLRCRKLASQHAATPNSLFEKRLL
jgi:hypothetical protein